MNILMKILILVFLPIAALMARAPHVDEGSYFNFKAQVRNLSSTNTDESCQNIFRSHDCVQFDAATGGGLIRFILNPKNKEFSRKFEIRLKGFCTLDSSDEIREFIVEKLSRASRIDLKEVQLDEYSAAQVNIIYDGKSLIDELFNENLILRKCY